MREQTSTPTPRIRFRVERANEIAAEHGLRGVVEKAHFFGLRHPVYSRVVKGHNRPGESFIAAVLAARPEQTFEALFEVVEVAA